MILVLSNVIPYAEEQGIFQEEQGIFGGNQGKSNSLAGQSAATASPSIVNRLKVRLTAIALTPRRHLAGCEFPYLIWLYAGLLPSRHAWQ